MLKEHEGEKEHEQQGSEEHAGLVGARGSGVRGVGEGQGGWWAARGSLVSQMIMYEVTHHASSGREARETT